jgi:uncharacterized UBP type Zn finger protein
MPATVCDHLDQLDNPPPSGTGCVECLETGGQWVHLRRCLACGHIGCCDNSPGTHATKHFHATNHPLIQSYEPGEDWIWCYVEEVAFELPDFPGYSHP